MSIGSKQEDPLLATLISEGILRNMIFVAPVGNNSHSDTMSFPASHLGVTAVAGFDDMNRPVPNANLTAHADATAPSEHISSAIPENHHNFFNGTSFSAATITGLLALSLEKGHSVPPGKLPSSKTSALWKEQFSAYINW